MLEDELRRTANAGGKPRYSAALSEFDPLFLNRHLTYLEACDYQIPGWIKLGVDRFLERPLSGRGSPRDVTLR